MSESNADPDWSLVSAATEIQEKAREILGHEISDDAVLRCVAIQQYTMDLALSIASSLELPPEVQALIVAHVDSLGHDVITEIFEKCIDSRPAVD